MFLHDVLQNILIPDKLHLHRAWSSNGKYNTHCAVGRREDRYIQVDQKYKTLLKKHTVPDSVGKARKN